MGSQLALIGTSTRPIRIMFKVFGTDQAELKCRILEVKRRRIGRVA